MPEHLVVVGGSYIGLEFAQIMRRLGARVASDDLVCVANVVFGESAHLSTSPSTGSTLEMIATASATRQLRIMCGRVWMFANDGARTCMR